MAAQVPEIQTANTRHASVSIRGPRARQDSQYSGGGFEFSREQVSVVPVLQPPDSLLVDVALRRCRQTDATPLQRDRSSLSTSDASMRRPATTSCSESARAAWSAARSASSSQSPGSRGSSSTSVPSGNVVGSSSTSRPARTRALIVIQRSVTPDLPRHKRGTCMAPADAAATSAAAFASLQSWPQDCETDWLLSLAPGVERSIHPFAQPIETLGPQPPVDQHIVAEEQRRWHLIARLRQRQPRRRKRDARQRDVKL